MKHAYIYRGTKQAIVASVLDGTCTVDQAARRVYVQPTTIKRWINTFGKGMLAATVTNK